MYYIVCIHTINNSLFQNSVVVNEILISCLNSMIEYIMPAWMYIVQPFLNMYMKIFDTVCEACFIIATRTTVLKDIICIHMYVSIGSCLLKKLCNTLFHRIYDIYIY